ncbi:type II toxin-antitoxin system VapB family antitoxin [uncultured Thiodictyon sp.]|uniref:type II toxin-antitoxin system VapB family antitoxin n=1 Tax=uncultured Thiodictyon sp. TaxID=1846217 RepID=UPI0025E199F0|nr:type II toxin-antitoxin system VapB family antitoxin [uncultured Thiodictyon sp.]
MSQRYTTADAIALLDHLPGEIPTTRQQTTADEIMAIAARVARAPVLDDRSADEILGYDGDGLPR